MDAGDNELIETLQTIVAKMATREDIAELRTELKDDFSAVRQELKGDIAGVKGELSEFRVEVQQEFKSIRAEIREIRARLDLIEAELRDHRGYAKKIDHLLERVSAIEKHLGIEHKIAA